MENDPELKEIAEEEIASLTVTHGLSIKFPIRECVGSGINERLDEK